MIWMNWFGLRIQMMNNNSHYKIIIKYLVKWTIISIILASVIGTVISIYLFLINYGEGVRQRNPWIILGLPIVGALAAKAYYSYGLSETVGNNLLILATQGKDEHIPLKSLPISMLGTIASHWCGASIGREDIATHLAGTLTLNLSKSWQLNDQEKRWLMMAAIGSGFAATFGTPIAGTVFAMEVVRRCHIHIEAMFPIFMTSFLVTSVTSLFHIPRTYYHLEHVPEWTVQFVIALLIACFIFGQVGHIYQWAIKKINQQGLALLHSPVRLAFVGGIIVILFVIIGHTMAFLGLSANLQKEAITGQPHLLDFLWKGIYTVFSVGTGFRGGTMTPIFDIGSTLGYSLGILLNSDPHFMAALGLIGIFSAATNTPLACFILGIELFGGDGAIMFFFVSLLSYIMSGAYSLFSSQSSQSIDML